MLPNKRTTPWAKASGSLRNFSKAANGIRGWHWGCYAVGYAVGRLLYETCAQQYPRFPKENPWIYAAEVVISTGLAALIFYSMDLEINPGA